MIVPGSTLCAIAVLGSAMALMACGGSDSRITMSGAGAPSSGTATSASSDINTANMKDIAAQVAKTTAGLSSPADSVDDTVEGHTAPGIALSVADQVRTAQTVQAATPLPTVTINCSQGGTATLALETASRSQLSPGDRLSLNADECVQGSDRINGGVSVAVSSFTGRPSSTDPWSAALGVTFTGFTHDDGEDVDDLNGDIALAFDQTAEDTANFQVTGNSLTFADNKGDATVSRTLTGFSASGSVNEDVFTYRTSFTLNGSIPQVGEGPFAISTTQDFVQQRGSAPSQGTLVVRASDNSTLTLTALDPANVNLSIDANGDGTVDSTTPTTWDELRTLLL